MPIDFTPTRVFSAGLTEAIIAGQGRVPDEWHEEFQSTLREWAGVDLTSGQGYFVVSGLQDLQERAARDFVLTASEALGRVMPPSLDAEFVRDVKDRGRKIESMGSSRYSDTRFGGHMHTDGMLRPGHVPDYFALYCVRQAQRGGELVLVDALDLVARLESAPDVLATLRRDFFFDVRSADPAVSPVVRRPILESHDTGVRVHYFREYIESGQHKSGADPLTAQQVEALDFVDSATTDPALRQSVHTGPGQMLVINNARFIHGRTDFVDDPATAGRLLLRTWIDASVR